MNPLQSKSTKRVGGGGRSSGGYKGVRMRAWGRWVSEVRVPKSGQRIWLGSYDSPEKAARAYDAAQYCIRGECGQFNFPASKKPELPDGYLDTLSVKDIKSIAFRYASANEAPSSTTTTTTTTTTTPPLSPTIPHSNTTETTMIDHVPSRSTQDSIENLQLDDFLMLDIEWIDSL